MKCMLSEFRLLIWCDRIIFASKSHFIQVISIMEFHFTDYLKNTLVRLFRSLSYFGNTKDSNTMCSIFFVILIQY